MPDDKVEEKKQRLLTALDHGKVMLHLDARRPGVCVPAKLKEEPHLRLNVSYKFEPPDLTVGEWGVRSTLSFSGVRFTVGVPWNAIFAITSELVQDVWLYPDDMPPEVLAQQQPRDSAATEQPPQPKPSVPALQTVTSEEGPVAQAQPEEEVKPRSRSHLRLVK